MIRIHGKGKNTWQLGMRGLEQIGEWENPTFSSSIEGERGELSPLELSVSSVPVIT